MTDFGHRITECSRLSVFRLMWAAGAVDQEFARSLVREFVRRGMRMLIVRFPSGRVPAAVSSPPLREVWAAAVDGHDGTDRSRVSCLEAADDRHALSLLTNLALQYDLVLVDGDCGLPLNTLRLTVKAEPEAGDEAIVNLRTADPRQGVPACADLLFSWLDEIWRAVPVWACVLIGGRSSRMGRPKHLLRHSGGRTWLEDTVEVLRPHVERVILAGQGEIPASLQGLTRIADVPGVVGPLAGIIAAMRWQPDVNWLLVACDMPSLTSSAVQWLLDGRRPGRWAVMPRLRPDDLVEPLFACYDRRCRILLEELRLAGSLRIAMIACKVEVHRPVVPKEYLQAWDNINTPAELELHRSGSASDPEQTGTCGS